MRNLLKTSVIAVFAAVHILVGGPAAAQGIGLIRDAETEYFVRALAEPIFEAAGLDAQAVPVYLVNDNNVNAFVAGGQRMFVHTGLLTWADDPRQIIGVFAHETGHITGGHLARTQDAISKASTASILAMLLGAAAIAAGSGEAGAAIMSSSGQVAQASFFRYRQSEEASADQAAMKFLNKTGQTGRGLLETFEYFSDLEVLATGAGRPRYSGTHPASRDRIALLKERVESSPYADTPTKPEYIEMHKRVKAKLRGYIQPPQTTLNQYPPGKDNSLYARYARSLAYNKALKWDKGLMEVESLVDEWPDDPFFQETRGYLLFEKGDIEGSIDPYRRAVALLPKEPMLHYLLAQSIIATEKPELNDEAIKHLEYSIRYDSEDAAAWRQLAIAYARADDTAKASLAQAEHFALTGRFRDAMIQARRASETLPRGSMEWMRAQDIMALIQSNIGDPDQQRGRRRR